MKIKEDLPLLTFVIGAFIVIIMMLSYGHDQQAQKLREAQYELHQYKHSNCLLTKKQYITAMQDGVLLKHCGMED